MKYAFILLAFALLACKHASKKIEAFSPVSEKYSRLLSKFKEISIDTFAVMSMRENNTGEYQYNGVPLDSSDAILFPEHISSAHFSAPPGLFACYKFSIDSLRTGLIARTPSEYSPTSVKLFIYTPGRDTLIQGAELAEFSGDAGAFIDINSWIFKDADKNVKAFIWSVDGTDNSVENPKDTTISITNHFYFYTVSSGKYDTLNTDISKLPLSFRNYVSAIDPRR
ncbi:MAG: hypothetical protein ABI688_07155 [Bacteroidota bacterium]